MAAGGEPWRWAAGCALAALLLATPGFVLNDEIDQAVALHNHERGSLRVQEHPSEFYEFKENLSRNVRFPGPAPVGSTVLDYLALPVLWTLAAADSVLPLFAWGALAAAGLAWLLLPIRWRRPGAAAGLLGFLVLAKGFRFPEADLDPYVAVLALQATNLALLAALAGLLASLYRALAPTAWRPALLATVGGPLLFWAGRLKYTLLASLLVAVALWLATQPPSRSRNLALGLVGGIAVWNNVGEGVILVAAGGLWILLQTWRSRDWRHVPSWLGAPVAGLLLGLVPWMLENHFLRGNPLAATYIASDADTGSGIVSETGSVWATAVGLGLGLDVWQGPLHFAANLLGQWTIGWRVDFSPIGVLALSPLLAFGLTALARRPAWQGGPLLASLFLLLHVALLTNRVALQGFGLDARLLAPALPALGVLAALGLQRWLHPPGSEAVEAPTSWPPLAPSLLAWLGVGMAYLVALAWVYPRGLRDWADTRPAFLAWVSLTVAVAALTAVARRSGLLPGRISARTLACALALSLPLLWNVLAAFGGISASALRTEGEPMSSFVPLVDDLRDAAAPLLVPASQLPIATDEFGRVVFHPEYGYCPADPSPCPWWDGSMNGTASTPG